MLSNADWQLLSRMLYRYVNRNPYINPLVTLTDYITKAYAYNSTVYSVINMRANAAKGVPWLVYKIRNTQKFRQYKSLTKKDFQLNNTLLLKEQALEEVEGTPINALLREPNPTQSFQDLIEGLFIYRDTTGNAYLYAITSNAADKGISQLHLLPADKTRIVGGSFVNPVKGYKFEEVWDDLLEPEKVIHWKYFNPIWDNQGRQLYGLSPLVAAARVINSDNSGVNNQNAAFDNEGVKGIVTGTEQTEIEFTPEQAEKLRLKFKRVSKRARDGEGNLYFQRAPVQYVKIGETPVDLGVLDSRKYNKEVLCNIFRIHPSLLSSDASTLNNLTEARKALMTISVMPDLDSLRDNLNNMFQRTFGQEWFVDYDIMAIQELQDDIETLSRTLAGMDWITIDEKRNATNYDEYDPEPGNPAKLLYTDMSKIPLGYGMDSGFDSIDSEIEKLRKQYKN